MFNGLTLLILIVVGLSVWGLYKLACAIGEAPVIDDAPLGRLDRLDGLKDRGE